MKHLYFLIILNCFFISISYCQVIPTYFNTKKLAQFTYPNDECGNIWGYTSPINREYAILGREGATMIYDVTNCAAPILKATFTDGSNSIWREYKVWKNFAYSVTEAAGEGLEMFDLTNPNNITFTQRNYAQDTGFFNRAHTLMIDTTTSRLYVNGARKTSSGSSNWTFVYQLNPNNIVPTFIRALQFPSISGSSLYTHDAYVDNNIFYGSHGNSGYYIWDVSNIFNPILIGYNNENVNNNNGYNHSSWPHPLDPTILYCAQELPDGQPMILYKLTSNGTGTDVNINKTFKHPLGAAYSSSYVNNIYHNPHAVGNKLYIAAYNDGIQIYDISDPYNPIRAASYDSYPQAPLTNVPYNGYNGAWGVYPFFKSGCICVSDINTGFHTFKLHFPKVEFAGGIHIANPGEGIVFRDSNNVYKNLSVTNSAMLTVTNFTMNNIEHRIDSADVELKTTGSNLFLTSPNGTKHRITISNTGTLTATPVSLAAATTNSVTFNGPLVIDNFYKGIIMRSPSNQRWKIVMKKNGSILTHKTDF
jgi:choice-of-anchor B domain-containing protein